MSYLPAAAEAQLWADLAAGTSEGRAAARDAIGILIAMAVESIDDRRAVHLLVAAASAASAMTEAPVLAAQLTTLAMRRAGADPELRTAVRLYATIAGRPAGHDRRIGADIAMWAAREAISTWSERRSTVSGPRLAQLAGAIALAAADALSAAGEDPMPALATSKALAGCCPGLDDEWHTGFSAAAVQRRLRMWWSPAVHLRGGSLAGRDNAGRAPAADPRAAASA